MTARRNPAKVVWFAVTMLASGVLPAAHADSWAGPVVAEVFSRDRNCFVRVTPGDNLAARAPDRSCRLVAEVGLQNPVAPVSFFVSNRCRLSLPDCRRTATVAAKRPDALLSSSRGRVLGRPARSVTIGR